MDHPILPPSTIGILGSGQLGRMLAIAARQLGYRVHIYSPERDTPAGAVADLEVTGEYTDATRLREFCKGVNVITFEFENVPAEATSLAAEFVPVRPDGMVLHTTQNRLREKTFLKEHDIPHADFRKVTSLADLQQAVKELDLPVILKTAEFGYDGKGQVKINEPAEVEPAWHQMNGRVAVLEQVVPFEKELSVVAARGWKGEFRAFPVFENAHHNHILDVTICPAQISGALCDQARDLAADILEKLQVVGVLTVELFLAPGNRLLVNELAPRVHNSGHLTIDCCLTSQFEQQIRAVCGLPLGLTDLHLPGAMANLLGDAWKLHAPFWAEALKDPNIKLHLYGKADPRPGRKMGHITSLGATIQEAERRVRDARARLSS